MIRTGLVSVTFRKLSPAELIALVARAHLGAIEWGGDIHVPHGDLARARDVRTQTENAGLRSAAYGSYYRLGHDAPDHPPFEKVLDTAVALGAPLIRVWAGTKGSAATTPEERQRVIADARRACQLASAAGVQVGLEWHGGTLTDSNASALEFVREVSHASLRLLWQPSPHLALADRLAGLNMALPHLANLHVYQWLPDGRRLPLDEGDTEWLQYFETARTAPGDRYALLEFVANDSPDAFLADAATLRRWLGAK